MSFQHAPTQPPGFAARPSVLWVGSKRSELQWLCDRIANACDLQHLELAMMKPSGDWGEAALREVSRYLERFPQISRVVLAAPHRMSQAPQLQSSLQRRFPELPTVVALGGWWEGAGRTGLQRRDGLAVSWCRWWDFWLPWLRGDLPAAVCPTMYQWATGGLDVLARRDAACKIRKSPSSDSSERLFRGLIVSRCVSVSRPWWQVAEAAGYACQIARTVEPVAPPDIQDCQWLLVDDAGGSASGEEVEFVVATARACATANPALRIAVAFTFARLNEWQKAECNGVEAIFAKPATGMGLVYWLDDCFSRNRSCAALSRT